jgi:miniconductance mechanosensitive channel
MLTELNINDLNGYTYMIIVAILVMTGSGLIVAFSHYFAKYFLITVINRTFGKKQAALINIMYSNHLFHRLAYLVPALLLHHYAYLFNFDYPNLKLYFADLIIQLTNIYITIGFAFVISAALNCLNERYSNLAISKHKPIKSYLQVIKIILFAVTSVLCASILFDKSPAYFFTGLGAATALILVVFKDSIMGFVASIQLAAYDMVRIGDWIEMPNFGADGEVLEISLNTVKVQNFDKTIVTIPSYALLTSGLKNWRGMQEAGGRRVKRSIIIDINSIQTCSQGLLENLQQVDSIMDTVLAQISEKSSQQTNAGIFRAYLQAYLRQHPGVHKGMKILIRHLQGTTTGLPIELYFFTNEINSEKYESIQADIFEHLYALMPRFNLRVFQSQN